MKPRIARLLVGVLVGCGLGCDGASARGDAGRLDAAAHDRGAEVGDMSSDNGLQATTALWIVQNQLPSTACTIPGTLDDLYRTRGTLDVSTEAGGTGYLLFPLIANDLPRTTGDGGHVEGDRMLLRRFDISLDLGTIAGADVQAGLQQFSVATSGLLDPGTSRSTFVKIIPDQLVPYLRAALAAAGHTEPRPTVTATVRVVAEYNGDTVASRAYLYLVQICSGCLVISVATCPQAGDPLLEQSNACGLPQDTPVVCCADPARGQVCVPGNGGN